MNCIFCKEFDVVFVFDHSLLGKHLYRAECNFCGAQGQSHRTAEDAAAEWQRLEAVSLSDLSLREAVALFENDAECNEIGTDAWAWLQRAREVLQNAEPLTTPETAL